MVQISFITGGISTFNVSDLIGYAMYGLKKRLIVFVYGCFE